MNNMDTCHFLQQLRGSYARKQRSADSAPGVETKIVE